MRLPLCPEDGSMSATAGDHHLPEGDLPLLASPTHRAPGGECHASAKPMLSCHRTLLSLCFYALPPSRCPSQDLDSCRLRLDPELGRHRYERKISFAGILDDEDGHDSLNSSSHTLKSDITCDDKKTPEAQGETASSPPPETLFRSYSPPLYLP